MNMKFRDRQQAGQILAARLKQSSVNPVGLVLALPRGGVPVGYEIARQLHCPLDIWLVRKLGVPDQPELAMGAIAAPNSRILNTELIEHLGISPEQIATVIQAETLELKRRDQRYRQGRPLPQIADQHIVLVDDGLATGATMQAAIAALKPYQPASLTLAIPIAAPTSLKALHSQVDAIICPLQPVQMGSISQWYAHFAPVTDEAVLALLDPGVINGDERSPQ